MKLQWEIRIDSLNTLEDFDACVELQDEGWGYEASDRMSQKVFLLASRIGGQVLGAYEWKSSWRRLRLK